jgi:hypothetical protein
MNARRLADPRYADPIIGLPEETIEAYAVMFAMGGWFTEMTFENYLRVVVTRPPAYPQYVVA